MPGPPARCAAVILLFALAACRSETPPPAPASQPTPRDQPRTAYIAYADARPILESFKGSLPAPLAGKSPQALEAAWPTWTAQHDAEIRARLAQGDEDSVVNFWLYGTSFTNQPRATADHLARLPRREIETLLVARLDDLVTGMAAPGASERLRFARQVVERRGIDLSNDAGRDKAREYLVGVRERVIAETARHRHEAESAATARGDAALERYATIYHDRGLSSDTSLPVDFAVDRALAAFASSRDAAAASVTRIAVIGPGLDFTDKAEGVDLYPPQTIQPFALIDSLLRSGLAKGPEVRLTAFDLSPRVVEHIRAAAGRAGGGASYDLQLPLARREPASAWDPALVQYWKDFGGRIGREISAAGSAEGSPVQLRAVRVRPEIVAALTAEDLDVVVQRRERPVNDDGFDLILATNVLVYYDRFEQALALANIAALLRPGGVFVTNYLVHPNPPLEPVAAVVTPVYWDRQRNGDTIFVYRRR